MILGGQQLQASRRVAKPETDKGFVTLEHLGKGYHGTDPVTGDSINVKTGDRVTVSAEKAKQLREDFPSDWQKPGSVALLAAPEPPKRKPVPVAPAPIGERFHQRRRGMMGLQFHASLEGKSTPHVIRELARGCARLGYDVGVDLYFDEKPGWERTSIRDLRHVVAEPRVDITWGVGEAPGHTMGSGRVVVDVVDSWRWYEAPYVRQLNETTDLLAGLGQSCVDSFRSAGAAIPIEIIRLGVDQSVYQPWPKDWALLNKADWGPGAKAPAPDTFLFVVAGFMQGRKGLKETIEAFREAFAPGEAALLIKGVVAAHGQSQKALVGDMRQGHTIGLWEACISEWDMARLLATADCYISAHRREGFGLMPLQAMACGTPAILTEYDGPLRYATPENSILVPPMGVADVEHEGDQWATIDVPATANAMRRAKAGAIDKLREAAIATAREWTWEKAAQSFVAAVEKNIGPVRKRLRTERPSEAGLLTIAFPVRNSASDVARILQSIRTTRWPGEIEVLVLDDASNPEQAEAILQACEPRKERICRVKVRLIRSDAWVGCEGARAIMVDEARGEWLFETDCDVEFTDREWAMKLKRFHEAQGKDCVLTPLILDGKGQVWSAGGTYRPFGDPPKVTVGGHEHEGKSVPENLYAHSVPYAPGAGWFSRREAMVGKRRLCPGYFPTMWGDPDMSFWLWTQGMPVFFVPEAVITHHHGSFTAKQIEGQRIGFDSHKRQFEEWWQEVADHDFRVRELRYRADMKKAAEPKTQERPIHGPFMDPKYEGYGGVN
jgi:glycosyltransferase involved in cell wall biosynthesis/GT2 family glycosyltransferase